MAWSRAATSQCSAAIGFCPISVGTSGALGCMRIRVRHRRMGRPSLSVVIFGVGVLASGVALVSPQRLTVAVVLLAFVALFVAFCIELRRLHGMPRHADEAIYSLQSLMMAVPQAFLAWNTNRGVVLWSEAAERLFGLARVDVLGLPLPAMLAPVKSLQATHLDKADAVTGITVALRDRSG